MALPLLLALAAVQEPAAPAPTPNHARAAWEKLQERLAAAQALHLDARASLADDEIPAEEMEPMAMSIRLRIARPGHGTAQWSTVFGEGEEAETIVIDWIGAGEKVYAVNHEEKWVMAEGEAWSEAEFGWFLPFLGPSWSAGAIEPSEISALPPPADHPEWTGLKVVGAQPVADEAEEEPSEPLELRLWLDAEGAIRRATSSLEGSARMEFQVDALELVAKPDLEKYRAALPEGYAILEEEVASEETGSSGLEGSLLAVGAQAPEAALIGMDGAEFTLASLRGKTVLLNFWFFH